MTEKIQRFKNALNNGSFTMQEELTFIDLLVNKYNLMTISSYAKANNVSQPYISRLVKECKIEYIDINNTKFILSD